jgi:uncharacterized protein YndB with AHSA1/START domain
MTTATTPVVRVQRAYNHSPERVFDAWLNPAALGEFMRPGRSKKSDAAVDARVGGRFIITMMDEDKVHPHTGEYLEISRPNKLVFTWHSKATELQVSTVTVEIKATKGGCELTLTHVGMPEKTVNGHNEGWSKIGELLADYLG